VPSFRYIQRCGKDQTLIVPSPEWIEPLTRRRITIYGIGLVAVLAAFGIAVLVVLSTFDLAPSAARYVSRTLDRPVTIGALRVRWGTTVTVDLHDLVIDNVPGGSEARLLRISHVDAEIAPWSLVTWAVLQRPPVIRHLNLDGVRLLLEHATDDRPNWRFGERVAAVRNARAEFPSLLDARVHDAEVDVRTSSGNAIRVHVETASIATPDLDQPVRMAVAGTYNDTPAQLSAVLHSFDELHGRTGPFGTDIHIVSADTALAFAGTMTDPLNVDGCEGRLTLTAPTLDQLLAIIGAGGRAALPVVVAGGLTHRGDLWRLSDAQGTFSANPFRANFNLREGARRAPDDLAVDANFSTLDLSKLGEGEQPGAMSMHIDDKPGMLLDAHVGAEQFIFGKVRASDLDLKLKMTPGALAIEQLNFRAIGGTGQVTAALKNTSSSSDIQFDAALNGVDTGQVSGLFGTGPMPLAGAADARASLRLTGNTLTEASRTNSGTVVWSMQGGSIQHKIVQAVSSDLRQLFSKAQGTVRIACLLGVLDLHDGVGRLAPMRIRTPVGTATAAGTIDLRRDLVDLTVASEAGSTSVFALDVPLHVSGPIRDPHVSPAFGSGSAATQASADLRAMPAALQDYLRRNPCLVGIR
jgi:uncharacterized protein involved in outer membrane biogenesis